MTGPGLVYTSPLKFTFRQRMVLAIVPPIAAWILKAIHATCRVQVHGQEHWDTAAQSGGVLVGFWHESMGIAACHHRNTGFHTLTSYSFDGEMAARVVRRFGLRALRGSSSRGGFKALAQIERAVRQGIPVGFTLDGPRGPRRIAKPGLIIAAAKTQRLLLPHAAAVSRAWRLNSWDRFPVPKPFSRIIVAFGPPIPPPQSPATEHVEPARQALESAMNALHQSIEEELGADPRLPANA